MTKTTLYFELPIYNNTDLLGFEYKSYIVPGGRRNFTASYMPTYKAYRIWRQDEKGIEYVKNRFSDPMTTPVDNDEFFLVKLKATNI